MVNPIDNDKFIWKLSYFQWGIIGLLSLMVGYIFQDGIIDMEKIWSLSEEYGYGYVIPVLSAFLIWQRKDLLEKVYFDGSWYGVALLVFGIFVFFIGYFATIYTIIEYGMVLAIFGITLSLVGKEAFKIIWIPLLFLVFMIPLPGFIFQSLSAQLQLISSELGVFVIRAAGISVYLEGNVIDLGSYQLQVVEACSGLRYLFPLVTLTFMTVYFFKVPFWVRAIVFLSSIPITVLMNSIRIGVIGVLVEYGGPEQAEGFLHDFEGWVVFMFCIGLIIFEMLLFTRFVGTERSFANLFNIDMPVDVPEDMAVKERHIPRSLAGSAIVLLVASIAVSFAGAREQIIPERTNFGSFPTEFSGWKGRFDSIEDRYLDVLQLDDYVIMNYRNDSDEFVNFYTAYYASQKAGVSAHSPRACIPGGGWKIAGLTQKTLDNVSSTGEQILVNRLVTKKGDVTQLVYYWFRQRGRDITSEYAVKFYLLWDAITKNRTDGTLIRLTTLLKPEESLEKGDQRLQGFLNDVLPQLDGYVPD